MVGPISLNRKSGPAPVLPNIDACNGHPLQSGADYHYHGVPYCITDTIDVVTEHSRILGFIRDGFPVYGPRNTNGKKLSNADLDECSGHVGATPEFPKGIYHYHLTDDAAPYSLNCNRGVVAARTTTAAAG
jgi:YHYH protein